MEPSQSGSRWYYVSSGQRHGPIGEAELKDLLRKGALGATDYVWHEEMPDWQEARRVPNLVPSLLTGAAEATPADTVPFNAPAPQQQLPVQQQHFQVQAPQPYYQPQPQYQYQPQPYGGGPGPYHPQPVAQLAPQPYSPHQPQFAQQAYPVATPQYAPAYQQVAVVSQPTTTTTGLKVAGFIFNIFIPPFGIGSFFVNRPGQAVAQILIWIFAAAISFTGVGLVVGIPVALGVWIWGIVTVATVPTAPPISIVHHTYHAPR